MKKFLPTSVLALLTITYSLSSAASTLSLEIFVSEPDEINVTSALIMGDTEMMVVSAQGTKSAAMRLADTIQSKGLALKYVFLTHAHLDHSQGAKILLDRFPNARFIAPPGIAKLQAHRMEPDDERAVSRLGDNAAVPSIPAEPYGEKEILIDGEVIEIWEDIIGDIGVGQKEEHDEPHVALYIPTLKALLPSDVVYFNGHVMMGGSDAPWRKAWVDQLNGWIALDLEVVVPGHMPKSSLPELTARGALVHTRDYIQNYDKVIEGATTSKEVVDQMINLYPDMPHRSALTLGTYINFKEVHRLIYSPKWEGFVDFLPDSIAGWINNFMFEKAQKSANPG